MYITLYSNGQWFSTVFVYNRYGFTKAGIDTLLEAIAKEYKYWKSPLYFYVYCEGVDVTADFLKLIGG